MLFKVREYRLKLVGILLGPCRSTTKRVEVEQTDRQTKTTTVTLRRMRRGLMNHNIVIVVIIVSTLTMCYDTNLKLMLMGLKSQICDKLAY